MLIDITQNPIRYLTRINLPLPFLRYLHFTVLFSHFLFHSCQFSQKKLTTALFQLLPQKAPKIPSINSFPQTKKNTSLQALLSQDALPNNKKGVRSQASPPAAGRFCGKILLQPMAILAERFCFIGHNFLWKQKRQIPSGFSVWYLSSAQKEGFEPSRRY